jgi:hypothetical protein
VALSPEPSPVLQCAPMNRRHRLPLLVILAAACGVAREEPNVRIATSFIAPKAVLDHVTALTVTVYEGATCDETKGATTSDGATKITESTLQTAGCANGVKFCGDLKIDKSDTPRVFAAVGKNGDATVATGCATVTIDQDAQPVSIKMFRFIEPSNCGDKILQPTEQCDPGGTPVCANDCQSNEILLSTGSSQNGTSTTAVPGDKTSPFFLWPTGAQQAGWFYAFYTDAKAGTGTDVAMRVMGDDLSPLASPPAPPAYSFGALFLPNNPTVFPPQPDTKSQAMPSAALLGGKIWVAFQDDNSVGANGQDIHLRSMSATGVADQTNALGVNGANGTGETGIQGAPSISAGTGGKLFVAWEDAAGKIAGRTLTPPATLGSQNDISTGNGNSHVSVAATPSGWVAVWQSGNTIRLRAINPDGTPSGAEQTVNEGSANAEKPSVAALADGRFAVAFGAGGDLFVQRFDAKGGKIAGDQTSPVNDIVKDGTQSSAAIGAAGGTYVAAWLDDASGHVRARNLGGSGGFLFNNVDGQASEYKASKGDGRKRAHPAVASGGATPFVAIGWEDNTGSNAGIVARRFPLPSE